MFDSSALDPSVRSLRIIGAAAILWCAVQGIASAAPASPKRGFPLLRNGSVDGALRYDFDDARHSALRSLRTVRFEDVELPALGRVDLELQRVRLVLAEGAVHVNGLPSSSSAYDELSMWEGRIVGRADSEVFLAFSRFGSRGYLAAGGLRLALDAAPGANRDWKRSFSVMRLDDGTPPPAMKSGAPFCGAVLPRPAAMQVAKSPATVPTMAAATTVVPIYEARIAIETDEWFYSLFGDLQAAQTYYFELMGAVSNRYREQIGVIFKLVYSGFYTTTDPWLSADFGLGSLAMLFEFQAAWQFGAGPVAADLYHFISGASLGGGVGYLPGLCDPQYGFGTSGDVGGQTPFPIAQGPLNWDFMVVAHEIGHNFGAPHTHDYCPPIDECAPGGFFGLCQAQQNCTSSGTLMSYCHLCPGSLSNITTYFHPLSAADCRTLASAGCLPLYEGVTYASNLGYALAGSNGTPTLDVTYELASHTLSLVVGSAPKSMPGVLFVSTSTAYLPLFSGTLIPALQVMVPVTTNSTGRLSIAAPIVSGVASLPGGATFYAQAWFSDSTGLFAATHGTEFELILP